jgi:hypothetical protein
MMGSYGCDDFFLSTGMATGLVCLEENRGLIVGHGWKIG